MRPLCALAIAASVVSCQNPDQPISTRAQTIGEVTGKLKDNWDRCLQQAFSVTRRQTPDLNGAAEMAFQSCGAEEQLLAQFVVSQGFSPEMFLALKVRTKQMLVASM